MRKVVGAVSRPALTYIANKIADVISGGSRRAVRKPRVVHSAGSFRPSGMGVKRRRPLSTLTRTRRTTTIGTGHRKPRAHLTRRVRRIAF